MSYAEKTASPHGKAYGKTDGKWNKGTKTSSSHHRRGRILPLSDSVFFSVLSFQTARVGGKIF